MMRHLNSREVIMNLSDEELKKEQNHLELTTKLLRQNISDLAQDLYDNE